jgi:hypothetical protein
MRLDFNAYFYKTQLHQVNCAVNSLKTNTIEWKKPTIPTQLAAWYVPQIIFEEKMPFQWKKLL